ncbi:MAG: helix-turn-helix domain-containing protein [Clostridia bacterium]|nr:helix-turn-helix domain-containing protein [Clostridia bacterium]
MRTKNTEFITKMEQFIDAFQRDNGVSPTVIEIAEGTGMSKSNVSRYLQYMRENGIINYDSTIPLPQPIPAPQLSSILMKFSK